MVVVVVVYWLVSSYGSIVSLSSLLLFWQRLVCAWVGAI